MTNLHNKILVYLNRFPLGLTFAQIYDEVKPGHGLESVRTVTKAVYELACENLLSCNEVFAEASNGATRERQMLYTVSQRGKFHLLGLVLIGDSSTQNIFDNIDGVSPVPSLEGLSSAVKGGGESAHKCSLPPSLIQTETERVNRVMAAVSRIRIEDVELCHCGREAKKVCACGKQVCAAHWYDSDGNNTLSDKDGMCSECVDAVQVQTWGEMTHGIAGRQ